MAEINKELVTSIKNVLCQSVIKEISLHESLQKLSIEIEGITIIILYRMQSTNIIEGRIHSIDVDKYSEFMIVITNVNYCNNLEQAIIKSLSFHKKHVFLHGNKK